MEYKTIVVPQTVALNAPCPVLVLPQTGAPSPACERVMVAWNGSQEAARAVRLALPFLARAGVRRHRARGDVRSALLVLASETRADLLVMGCHGHSRLRAITVGVGHAGQGASCLTYQQRVLPNSTDQPGRRQD